MKSGVDDGVHVLECLVVTLYHLYHSLASWQGWSVRSQNVLNTEKLLTIQYHITSYHSLLLDHLRH